MIKLDAYGKRQMKKFLQAPCPFCGHEYSVVCPVWWRESRFFSIVCLNIECAAHGPPKKTKPAAKRAWGKRKR